MAGKDNAWLLVGLLSFALWAFAGEFASAQAPDWETYMEAATKAYREGRYAEAEKQLKAALKEAEDFRPEDPRVATSLNNLAGLYHAQGKYAEAEPLLKRSLAIREKVLGPEHPNVATSLNNLAELYRVQGHNAAAEPLLKRALAIQEKVLRPEHPNVATSLSSLAGLYHARANNAAAEPLFKRALAIQEKALGPEHPSVATSLNNLAAFYHAQGNYAAAEPLLKRALAIQEEALGPEHPDVARSLNNLAGLYQAQGHNAAAEPLLKRALAIRERALGPEHPAVATSLSNLAELYRVQGHNAAAEPLLKRALAIREETLGPEHPDVARSLNNLAGLNHAQANYVAAEPLLKRALAIQEKVLGPEHPDVARSLNNLAGVYRAQGNYTAAEPLLKCALAIREKALGPEHPDVATSLNNLAELYHIQGNYAAAEPLFKRALAIREKALGPEHPDVATSLNNLAELYDIQGDYAAAEPLYKRLLAIREKALGPEHPDAAQTLNNLARLYRAQGNEAAAEPLFKRLRATREKVLEVVEAGPQSRPASTAPPIAFVDETARSGVNFKTANSKTSEKYLMESMVGGVAMLDFDADGLLDLFLVNGAALADPMPEGARPDKSEPRYWNRLYRNDGDGTFTDVTEEAGVAGHSYGMGAVAGDYDNDGHADLYVTNYGNNILYHNNGDGTFRDVTEQAGVGGGGWSASAAFLDYDRDGHLDLFVTRYVVWDFQLSPFCGPRKPGYRAYCHPDRFRPISHLLYRNNGDGTFTDVSRPSGVEASPGKGLGVAVHDFNRDGWPDIFVANDSFPQQLFRNNGDGTFTETALLLGLAYDDDGKTFAGMGTDFGDYDNDGWPDIFVNALAAQRYALFRNDGDSFEYASGPTEVARITLLHSGWGTKFVDFDNDGWKDLMVGQGHVMDNIHLRQTFARYLEPLLLMRNLGGRFENVSKQAGPAFQVPLAARGAAFGDLNNDGRSDIIVSILDGPALVLRNASPPENHWLLVNTVGTRSNRDGIGAALRLVSGSGREQRALVSTAGSYMSSNDKRVHFGLGSERTIRLLEISWPSGVVQRLEGVQPNQILTVREPERTESAPPKPASD